MKKKEKRMILLLVVIAIVIVAILLIVRSKNNANGKNNGNGRGENLGEFVQVLEDGTMLNTSDKLNDIKTFGIYELSNIQVTVQDGQTLILADVKNIGEEKADVAFVDIVFQDKKGKEIGKETHTAPPY